MVLSSCIGGETEAVSLQLPREKRAETEMGDERTVTTLISMYYDC